MQDLNFFFEVIELEMMVFSQDMKDECLNDIEIGE